MHTLSNLIRTLAQSVPDDEITEKESNEALRRSWKIQTVVRINLVSGLVYGEPTKMQQHRDHTSYNPHRFNELAYVKLQHPPTNGHCYRSVCSKDWFSV